MNRMFQIHNNFISAVSLFLLDLFLLFFLVCNQIFIRICDSHHSDIFQTILTCVFSIYPTSDEFFSAGFPFIPLCLFSTLALGIFRLVQPNNWRNENGEVLMNHLFTCYFHLSISVGVHKIQAKGHINSTVCIETE